MSSHRFDDHARLPRRPPPPFDRKTALATSIGALENTWLNLECAGARLLKPVAPFCSVVGYPLRLLGKQRGREHLLGALLARFRCQRCGGRIARALLTELPVDVASDGETPCWVLPIVPATWEEVAAELAARRSNAG